MDGIHDLGGTEGFGPLPLEHDEPVFHHDWEGRAMAMRLLMSFWGAWNTDGGRHSIECLPPADYLSMTYFEKWLASLVNMSVDASFISRTEVEARRADGDAPLLGDPPGADVVRKVFPAGSPTSRAVDAGPRFEVGDRVRTAEHVDAAHTRLPRYARGRTGDVVGHHGAHVFPDSNASGAGEDPRHLYTVRFSARELWGAAAGDHTVSLDLWESYLAGAS